MTAAEIARPPVHRITLAQLAVLAPMCLVFWVMDAKIVSGSLLSGGLVAVLPQVYFALRTFRWRGAKSAKAIARAGYSAEVGKFLLSGAGFALVFTLVRPVSGVAVIVGFLIMWAVQIIGSWLLLRTNTQR